MLIALPMLLPSFGQIAASAVKRGKLGKMFIPTIETRMGDHFKSKITNLIITGEPSPSFKSGSLDLFSLF